MYVTDEDQKSAIIGLCSKLFRILPKQVIVLPDTGRVHFKVPALEWAKVEYEEVTLQNHIVNHPSGGKGHIYAGYGSITGTLVICKHGDGKLIHEVFV